MMLGEIIINMNVTIRKFEEADIPNKIKWINDSQNNQFLHYDIPLEYEKTLSWFKNIKQRTDRYDAVIEADGVPVGLIGLLSIDKVNRKAEYYISMGEMSYKGKGVASVASRIIIDYAFDELKLNKIYLYTETQNQVAQRLFEKVGFVKEGYLIQDMIYRGRIVDRYVYGITRESWK